MKTLNKTKEQVKAMTQKEFQDLLVENTDRNYHTENVVYIAYRYGYNWQIALGRAILKKHLKLGCMNPSLNEQRNFLLKTLKAEMLPCHQQTIWECL